MSEWIHRLIQLEYNIPVSGMVRMRSVVGLMSEEGSFILKRIPGYPSSRRMGTLAEILEKLQQKGVCVAPFLRTRKGVPFLRIEDVFWVVQPWIQGHHCDYGNSQERMAAIGTIANMHQSSVVLPEESQIYMWVPPLFEKYGARLERCKRILQTETLPVDFPKEWMTKAENVMAMIRGKEYKQAFKRDREQGTVCHRDLAPHNLLYANQKACLIDFDLAGTDVRAHDLYQMINHTLFLTGWNETIINEILGTYQMIAPLCEANRKLLRALFTYPALLFREIHEYGKEKEKEGEREKWRTRFEWTLAIEEQRQTWIKKGGF